MIPEETLAKLRPWQRPAAQHLYNVLQSGQNCIDASDCGVGKTFTAMAVVAALKRPTLVCAPKISETQWHQAAEYFGDSISFVGHEMLRTGKTLFGSWQHPLPPGAAQREYFQCQICLCKVDFENYFPCHCNAAGTHCVAVKKRQHRYGRFTFAPEVGFIVADELHRLGGLDSLNADMLIAARRQGILTLGLSATLASSPLHLRAIGYLLGLHGLDHDVIDTSSPWKPRISAPHFRRWASRHKVRPDHSTPGHPLKWFAGAAEQQAIMRQIRAEIIPARGVRVCKDEIPGFPEVEISADLFDLDESGQIDQIYAEMFDSLAALDARKQLDVAPESAITVMLRANQRVEILKVPLAVQLALDYNEKGFSIGIFCNFSATIDALAERLGTQCIIDGRKLKQRQPNIDAFQANAEKNILVNNAAGGLSLTLSDIHGGHPRGGLVFPSFSAVVVQQVFGRFPRDGAKSKSFYRVLLAAKTGDTKIHAAFRAKLNCLASLNDGDLVPENLNLTTSAG